MNMVIKDQYLKKVALQIIQCVKDSLEQLKMIYEQMQMDACVVDDDIEGFDEEMEKGTILFSGSHR